jgi:hypothetical protein
MITHGLVNGLAFFCFALSSDAHPVRASFLINLLTADG